MIKGVSAMAPTRFVGFAIAGLFLCQQSIAQELSAVIDIKDIGSVCSGIERIYATGGRGKISTEKGYTFEVAEGDRLQVTQTGRLLATVEHFTYDGYVKCVAAITTALVAVKPPPPRACAIPENGVDHYKTVFDTTKESGWRGGGYDPTRWCNDVIAMLKGEHPGANVAVLSQGEDEESKCKPFNCPQYNYKCSVHVEADPIYKVAVSSLCP